MNSFFSEFSPVSKAGWLEKVTKDLKGKSIEALEYQWTEHIRMLPFFHPEDEKGSPEPMPGATPDMWAIGERISSIGTKANIQLLEGLQQGVNAPLFHPEHPLSLADWEVLLDGVEPQMIHIFIDPAFEEAEPATWLDPFLAFLRKKNVAPDDRRGALRISESAIPQALHEWAGLQEHLPAMRKFYIDGRSNYKSSHPESEIALAAYMAFYRVVQAEKAGISIEEAHDNLCVVLSVDTSFFKSLAKIRAFKLLWANLLEVADWPVHQPPFLSVHFAEGSQDDAVYTNMIRATTQAMSAIFGGADHLLVQPAAGPSSKEGPLAARVARNLHHILSMESHLDQVVDPAAGSYFLETLTNRIAEEAYDLFRNMPPPAGL